MATTSMLAATTAGSTRPPSSLVPFVGMNGSSIQRGQSIRCVVILFSAGISVTTHLQVFDIISKARQLELVELETSLSKHSTLIKRGSDRKHLKAYFSEEQTTAVPFLVQTYIVDPVTRVTDLQKQVLQSARGQLPKGNLKGIGSQIFQRTTWDWMKIGPKSMTREITLAAHFAVLEMARVQAYRSKIVKDTTAAHLRLRIADALGPLTDGVTREGKVIYEWSFWDRLTPDDITKVAPIDPVATERRKLELQYAHEPIQHQQEIRGIVKLIEESRVATIAGLKGGPLERNVADACDALIDVRSFTFVYSHIH
jgi:hypothetical protein